MNTTLFNSVYTFGKTELNLTDKQALALAQFIVDNIDTLTSKQHRRNTHETI